MTEMAERWAEPAIRVLMMPRDTNGSGTIFGGVILSFIDQAGAIEARRQGCRFMVTVSMDKVVFHEPVFVGDLVSFWTETIRITDPNQKVVVTEAHVVYVNVGEDRKPKPIQRRATAY